MASPWHPFIGARVTMTMNLYVRDYTMNVIERVPQISDANDLLATTLILRSR